MKDSTCIYKYKNDEIISVRNSTFSVKSFKEHMHRTFSIGLILGGSAEVSIGDEKFNVSSNDVVVVNPRQKHCCNPVPDSLWSYYMFYINENWFQKKIMEITGATSGNQKLLHKVIRKESLVTKLKLLYKLILSNAAVLEVEEKVYSCIEMLVEHQDLINLENSKKNVTEAIEYMNEKIEENLSLEDISMSVNLSPYHFLRIFKNETGITPHKYLINLKIISSYNLLEKGLSSAEISYQLGFTDQSHFIKTFKDFTGITPGQYVKSVSYSGSGP
ncbi:MAG: helix-turn-helix transcriptional regulator [Spirochaetes bacterium]|nr:helix-turn-helix transcriptional regulator [Spirochaetota bacterium]